MPQFVAQIANEALASVIIEEFCAADAVHLAIGFELFLGQTIILVNRKRDPV